MTGILGEQPAWVEHLARVAEADDRRAKVTATIRKATAAYREALDAHKEAVERAVQAEEPVPEDEPERPSPALGRAMDAANRERDRLYAEGKRVKASLTADVEAAARERWDERKPTLTEAVAVLEQAAAALRQDAGAVAECRSLADRAKRAVPVPTAGERTHRRWDVAAVVDAVQTGRDPFELMPVARPDGPIIERDDGAPESTPPQLPTPRHRKPGFTRL